MVNSLRGELPQPFFFYCKGGNMEEWKDVVGLEGLYRISSEGRCVALERRVRVRGNITRIMQEHEIKPCVCTNGYLEYQFTVDGIKYIRLAHRVVAQAFIPNPNQWPEVNHKDENITNNSVDNLEWCTSKYNANFGHRNEKCYPYKQCKRVRQYSLSGEFIKEWGCMGDAGRSTGITATQIARVCKGRQKQSGGYRWEYA